MGRLEIWNKTDGIYVTDGTYYTPERVIQEFPYAARVPAVMGVEDGLVVSFDSLPMLVGIYEIDPALDESEKLVHIQRALDRGRNPQYDDVEEALAILNGEVE